MARNIGVRNQRRIQLGNLDWRYRGTRRLNRGEDDKFGSRSDLVMPEASGVDYHYPKSTLVRDLQGWVSRTRFGYDSKKMLVWDSSHLGFY